MAVDKKKKFLDYKTLLVPMLIVLVALLATLFFEWKRFNGHVALLDKLRTDYALRVKKMDRVMNILREHMYCSVCSDPAKAKKKSSRRHWPHLQTV